MLNAQIYQLWNNCPRNLRGPRVPKFVTLQPAGGVLFLALNPSFPQQLPHWILNEPYVDGMSFTQESFVWENFGDFDELKASAHARLHQVAKIRYPWFCRLNCVAQAVGESDYAHVDLFLRLEAQSGELPDAYRLAGNRNRDEQPEFIRHQLDLAFDQIQAAHPRAIVAVYAGAADIFLRYFGSRFPASPVSKFQKVEEVLKLSKTTLPLPWGQVPFFRCSGLPSGRWGMSNQDFDRVCHYFAEHYGPPLGARQR